MLQCDEERLFMLLTKNYDTRVRPVTRNVTTGEPNPIIIWLQLYLIQIADLEERKEILHTKARLKISWHDPRLIWNRYDILTFLYSLIGTKKQPFAKKSMSHKNDLNKMSHRNDLQWVRVNCTF